MDIKNERPFYYKSFLKSIYGIFGVFVTMNGFFMLRSGKKIEGWFMICSGIILLLLFYYYNKTPYITLMGSSKLKYKAHPLYPLRIISKDFVKKVEQDRELIYKITYIDSNEKELIVSINVALVDKTMQDSLVAILKTFDPDYKNIENEKETE